MHWLVLLGVLHYYLKTGLDHWHLGVLRVLLPALYNRGFAEVLLGSLVFFRICTELQRNFYKAPDGYPHKLNPLFIFPKSLGDLITSFSELCL